MTTGSVQPYDDAFYVNDMGKALQSARVVVPLLLTLIRPKTVIDIGCGLGAWLRAFQENGVETVRGLDGPWVDRSKLLIDPSSFQPTDLRQPIELHKEYDLALCLEVVEHLPYLSGRRLVRTLTAVSPLVLFSAAIPGQGGTSHINEQWPSYWQSEFHRYGFVRLDPIRPRILQDRRVSSWYRQNVFLYAAPDILAASPSLRAEQHQLNWESLEIIRKDILDNLLRQQTSFRCILAQAPRVAMHTLQRRFYRLFDRTITRDLHAKLHEWRAAARRWGSRLLAARNTRGG